MDRNLCVVYEKDFEMPKKAIDDPQTVETVGDPLESVVYQKLKKWVPAFDDEMPSGLYQTVIQSVERPLIKLALEHTGGNQCRAAHLLGINRNTLRSKINLLGLNHK